MEDLQSEVRNMTEGSLVAGQRATTAEHAAFTASVPERLAAFATYALGYLYIHIFFADALWDCPYLLALFTLGFVALTEYLNRSTPRSRESWVWLGCVATLCAAVVCHRGNAWDGVGAPFFFLHIFAVWWVLSRSAALLDGESGHLLPLDALDGFVVFPFSHFFHRARTVFFSLSALRTKQKKEKADAETVLWSLLMIAAALGLLLLAANLLASSDNGFAALFSGVADWFQWHWTWDFNMTKLVFSLPVGAYLFGLLDGALRQDKDVLRARSRNVGEQMAALRGVPEHVWLTLMALFCLLYLTFFAVQGRYLFGAFTRTLPDGFVVSEYARQGFFELCKVMAINFALLWLVMRSSKIEVRQQKAARVLCLVLLAESFLLAVVAFSKLALYISCFGFTPRRLQSTWLVCVLAFGTGCAAWSLTRGGKAFRVWMIFGAVTLSLLCLY